MTVESVRTLSYDDEYTDGFVRGGVAWVPWLEPLPMEELTERHYHGLVYRERDKDRYFRLQIRDPEIVRSRTDFEIFVFFDDTASLPRGERELAATAVSRVDGSVLAVSGHGKHTANFSEQAELTDLFIQEGADADLGERWNAIVEAAGALAVTPIAFGEEHIARMRAAGLDTNEIADVIHSASFMGWATRLVLSLGRTVVA